MEWKWKAIPSPSSQSCLVNFYSSFKTYVRICVQEAHTLGIPLIGIADTNCDPEELDYVIPGNDDAIRAVKLIVAKMADAVIEANQGEEMTPAVEETVEA